MGRDASLFLKRFAIQRTPELPGFNFTKLSKHLRRWGCTACHGFVRNYGTVKSSKIHGKHQFPSFSLLNFYDFAEKTDAQPFLTRYSGGHLWGCFFF